MSDEVASTTAARRMDAPAPIAGLVTVTAWSSAFVGIRAADQTLSPGALALGRLVVSTAAMIINTGPLLITLFAGIFLREGFPRGLLAGCAVAFAGCVVIGLATIQNGARPGLGIVLCMVAVLAYSAAVVVQKPVLARVSPFQVTWLGCVAGAIACLPFTPAFVTEAAKAGPGRDRMDDLPRLRPAGTWLHNMGVRVAASQRRADGIAQLPDSGGCHRARLGRAGPETTMASHSRRSPLSPWRLFRPPTSRQRQGCGVIRQIRSALRSCACRQPRPRHAARREIPGHPYSALITRYHKARPEPPRPAGRRHRRVRPPAPGSRRRPCDRPGSAPARRRRCRPNATGRKQPSTAGPTHPGRTAGRSGPSPARGPGTREPCSAPASPAARLPRGPASSRPASRDRPSGRP